jgi:hypothetical protein
VDISAINGYRDPVQNDEGSIDGPVRKKKRTREKITVPLLTACCKKTVPQCLIYRRKRSDRMRIWCGFRLTEGNN